MFTPAVIVRIGDLHFFFKYVRSFWNKYLLNQQLQGLNLIKVLKWMRQDIGPNF